MSQLHRLGKGNTTITRNEEGETIVTLYHTQVVRFSDKRITLNSGGWRTATTKTRMNQTSNQFSLGYRVSQVNGEWFVDFKGGSRLFVDGMDLIR